MSDSALAQLAAKIRNLFQPAEMTARNDDASLKIETVYSRTIDNLEEAFPYGFKTKAEKGTVTVLCAGGSLDAVKILPVENSEDAPELKDGDVAVYSSGGNCVICRKSGSVEVKAASGKKIYIGNEGESVCSLLCGLADDILAKFKTFGSPPQHTVAPDTVTAVNAWKEKVKQTFSDDTEN